MSARAGEEKRRDARHELPGKRLIVVSNRLPVVVRQTADGYDVAAGTGGLVTAMQPILEREGGQWIGWPGTTELGASRLRELIQPVSDRVSYRLRPVPLDAEERDNYYYGFANEVLWPLFHDLQTLFNFDPDFWRAYREVNRKFARAVDEHVRSDDFVWVHDYHLTLLARELRRLRPPEEMPAISYFLHTPFPSRGIYMKLPWRYEVLRGLLAYDLVGLQTLSDRRNLADCARRLLYDVEVRGDGAVVDVRAGSRRLRIGSFPISVDFSEFEDLAGEPEVERRSRELRSNLPAEKLLLGVDRLDYTKGIPFRLRGFRKALELHPELRRRLTLVQVVVPSREGIPEYSELKGEIEELVGEINGRFGEPDWVPIHYMYRSLDRPELLAHYRAADIALVTPLKDGMNLVSKEYCAGNRGDGVLVLSEFAGAAAQLQEGALLVNPYDIEGLAAALHRAATMSRKEREERMRASRDVLRRHDVFWWLGEFLRAARGAPAGEFEPPAVYEPREPAEE